MPHIFFTTLAWLGMQDRLALAAGWSALWLLVIMLIDYRQKTRKATS
jgi:hypothetical protein